MKIGLVEEVGLRNAFPDLIQRVGSRYPRDPVARPTSTDRQLGMIKGLNWVCVNIFVIFLY
jgi:hypothetical protein